MAEIIDSSQIAAADPIAQGTAPIAGSPNIIDPHDIEDVAPDHSNGLTPNTPINISPLSITDRLKMSLGNERGNEAYLKSKPELKSVINDGSGNFTVQTQDGFWHRVDPNNGGDGDAWQRTKEILSDTAELIPTAAKMAGAIGAGVAAAPLTGGIGSATAGAVVGSGLEGYRTSLGRLVGTYNASPEEQMKDLGVEALFNLGGSAVGAGMKPVASMLGRAAKGIGSALADMAPAAANAAKDAIASSVGFASGVGQKAVRMVLDDGEAVSGALGKALTGRSREKAIDFLKSESVDQVKNIAKMAQPALNNIYSSLKDDLLQKAGPAFKANVDDVLRASWADAVDSGIGAVIKDGVPIEMTSKEILKNGLPEGAQFGLVSLNALKGAQRASGTINPLANDPESYKLIENMYQTLSNFSGLGEQTGKRGFNNILEMKKVIGDTAFKLGTAADEAGLNVAKRTIARVEAHIENRMLENMDPGVQGSYVNLMKGYSNAKEQMSPLINALSSARTRGDAVFEPLLNKLQSRPGSAAAIKDQFSNAIELISEKGNPAVKDILKKIDINDAASQFTPIFRKGISGAMGVGLPAGAAMLGHPEVALGLGAAGLATSPRAALNGIRAAQSTGAATGLNLAVKSMFNLKDMISNLDPKARGKLVQSPALINGLFQAVAHTPQAAAMAGDLITQHGLQQAAPTPAQPLDQGQGQ